MSRASKLTLGTLAVASAIALAQSTIEPPRRAAPAAAAPVADPFAVPAPAAGTNAENKPSIATGVSPQAAAKLNEAREKFNRNRQSGAGGGNRGVVPPVITPAGAPGIPSNLPGAVPTENREPLARLVNADGTPIVSPAPAPAPTATLPGGLPAVPGLPTSASATPGAVRPAAAAGDANQYMDFNSNPLATVEDAIAEYEANTNPPVTVLRANNLTGNVPLIMNPQAKMTKSEYVDFLKASMMVNGFSIHEYSPTLHSITFTGQATPLFDVNPPKEGQRVYTRAEDLPERDEFVNYFMRFDHLAAQDAITILGQPKHASGKFTAVPPSGILITESVPVIRSLIAIKKEVDIDAGGPINRFVQLKLADAEEVAQIIQQIQQQQNAAKSAASGTSGTRVVSAPNAANQLSNQLNNGAPGGNVQAAASADGSSVAVLADRRTNRILLNSKSKYDIDYMAKLIHDFDSPSEVNNFVTYQLRYIRVGDFIDLASGALEARGFGSGSGSAGGGGAARQAGGSGTASSGNQQAGANGQFGSNGNRNSQFGTSASGRNSTSSASRNGSASSLGGGGGGSRSGGGGSSATNTLALPTSITVGKTLLISDPQSNSIIISGPPESRDQIRQLILEIDRRPLQVHIDCVIAELNLNDDLEFGLDLLRKVDSIKLGGSNVDVGGLFNNTSSTGGIIDPALLTNIAGFPAGLAGINTYFQVGDLVNGYIHASEGTGRIKVIQKPSVSTANNEPAYISIGQEVPYPGQQQSSLVNGGTTSLNSSVEYKDVLLSLDVTPLINSKNEVTLQISQQNNNLAGSVTINGDAIPIISQQELNTKLTVPNGGIAIIGGLIKDSRSNNNSGAPFLSRIPLLKYILGASTKNDSRQELMIFIQPRIMETTDEMVGLNASEIRRTRIGPEAEQFARPPVDTSNVLLPTANGSIPFDNAGIPTGQDAHPGFWKRLGNVFKRKTNVPVDPVYPR